MNEDPRPRWHLHAFRLLFAVPVALVVASGMAARTSLELSRGTGERWVSVAQASLGAIAIVCLVATTLAPRRIALVLSVVDGVLILAWLLVLIAQGSS